MTLSTSIDPVAPDQTQLVRVYYSPDRASHASDPRKPFAVGILDLIDPATNRGKFTGRNLEQLRGQYAQVEVLDLNEARRRQEEAVIGGPWPATADRFHELLGALPPCKRKGSLGPEGPVESFHLSELLVGDVALWAVRIGTRYFELNQRTTVDNADVVNLCRQA